MCYWKKQEVCFISDFLYYHYKDRISERIYIWLRVCVLLREKVKCIDAVLIDSCCIFDSLFPDRIYPKEEL